MNKFTRIAVIIIVVIIVGAVIAYKEIEAKREARFDPQKEQEAAAVKAALPRLVDLGAGKCIPCKMMAPILEELGNNYRDYFSVEFIDVWEVQSEAGKYGIKIIPTQIFFDAEGKELFRHEGFISKEDILAKWKELGVNVEGKAN